MGVPALVRISHVERTYGHSFNPLLYTVEVRHAGFEWVVRRRYHHFRKVHTALFMFRTGQVIKAKSHMNKADHTEKVCRELTALLFSINMKEGQMPLKQQLRLFEDGTVS